jgi:hypothetical protein
MLKSRIELWLSILSLLVSIGSPFVGYVWLQSEFRIISEKSRNFSALGFVNPGICIDGARDDQSRACDAAYTIEIRNKGKLPIKDVRVSIETRSPGEKIATDQIHSPMRFKTEVSGGQIFVIFEDAFPPGVSIHLEIGHMNVSIPTGRYAPFPAPAVLVYSEVTSTAPPWLVDDTY